MPHFSQRSKKVRVDRLLVENGYFETRTQAKSSILAGEVRVGTDCLVTKSNEKWEPTTKFTIAVPFPFVSRGALKLIPAIDKYLPSLDGVTALDIGASTGGFTDVMLQRGAAKVYAVDVGFGQLHYRLRKDIRVVCLEKINARYLSCEIIPDPIDVLTLDVSFISCKKILPATKSLLKPKAWVFILIKPQFEAEPHEVDKGGIVESCQVRDQTTRSVISFVCDQLNWKFLEVIATKAKLPRGNIEYMAVFSTSAI